MHNHSSDSSTDNDKKTKVQVVSVSVRESREENRYFVFEEIEKDRSIRLSEDLDYGYMEHRL